ncbi:tail sheath stabilizer and completion protein [Synechococcus phage S-SZBM1]|uniref:Tail sheath stabilizer and completion protein n=1 Tax=Synechococcus phage S-SZBM1 TaxID=2926475 RepID=A0AC61TSX0_9CAUD|nr:tail sheath stabilizer [Synechococcus phage S-SZBM1]UNH61314.1 tail sheath stabilizer and completion protein [Synechococcus phage S-SZBM1]
MLGTYSYHEIIKKTVVAFGTLFNNIELRRSQGSKTEVMKVPLAYGPKQKFLTRLRQVGDLTKKDQAQITLPRVSFEINGISYDPTRKVSPTQTIRHVGPNGETNVSYMPIPYNISFELAILSKNQDDALQILEQILPYFQPSFTITMNLVPELGEKKDYPVTLTSVNYEDQYEGDYDTRRTLIYTLQFVAKTYLYGPVQDKSDQVITKAIVDYATDSLVTAPREVRYTVTPDPIDADADDDFGFNELYSEYTDGLSRNPVTGVDE